MDECTNCKRKEHIVSAGMRVLTFDNEKRVCSDSICLLCGIGIREIVTPRDPTQGVGRGRHAFPGPRPKSKDKIIELKLHDHKLYQGWIEVIDELDKQMMDQLYGKTYSNHACHFLYFARILLGYVRNVLTNRLKQLDEMLKQ